MKKVVIIGDSGHAKVVADVIHSHNSGFVIAKLDDKYDDVFIENGIVKGPIKHIHELIANDPALRVIIGIGSNLIRKKLVSLLAISDEYYMTAVHKTAVISPSATISAGTVIMPGVIVNADATIGKHVILNSGSVIEHDTKIDDFAHISPCAVLTGGVQIGEGTHIGAGASIVPQKTVGAWTTVGAGAVVVSDINDSLTVVGVPAKVVKREGL
ncbi:acetyltransferase [Sporosarcina sp. OR05]|uniref:acetyltransferase n=1 Tax=Sporosarcina sp. OR05 TaxID=2969819 RepID=UPI003529E7E7